VNSFEVGEFIIVRIDTAAEEKTGIASVDDLVASELGMSAFCPNECRKASSLLRQSLTDISDHGERSGGGLRLVGVPNCQLLDIHVPPR
jgi:hypothetical protein